MLIVNSTLYSRTHNYQHSLFLTVMYLPWETTCLTWPTITQTKPVTRNSIITLPRCHMMQKMLLFHYRAPHWKALVSSVGSLSIVFVSITTIRSSTFNAERGNSQQNEEDAAKYASELGDDVGFVVDHARFLVLHSTTSCQTIAYTLTLNNN